jgi:hypothetical protein
MIKISQSTSLHTKRFSAGHKPSNYMHTNVYIGKDEYKTLGMPDYLLVKYDELQSAWTFKLVDIDTFSKKGVRKLTKNTGDHAKITGSNEMECGYYELEQVDDITFKLVKP